jgi:hypothetical protein
VHVDTAIPWFKIHSTLICEMSSSFIVFHCGSNKLKHNKLNKVVHEMSCAPYNRRSHLPGVEELNLPKLIE